MYIFFYYKCDYVENDKKQQFDTDLIVPEPGTTEVKGYSMKGHIGNFHWNVGLFMSVSLIFT